MNKLLPLACLALLTTACGEAPTAVTPAADMVVADLATPSTPVTTAVRVTTDEDYDCRGSVTGTFKNIFVPEGATCTVSNATVSGNILARDRSRLFVHETRTDGNIDGVEAAVVQVRGGTLGGSIQVQDGQSPSAVGVRIYGGTVLTQGNITIQKMNTGTISIVDARLLKGNIQVQENSTATRLEVLRNQVAQNLEVFVNRGAGAKFVQTNTVSQKLSCKENTGPFTGRPNVAGDVEGQCRR